MILVPSLLTRSGLVPRLMMQLAASALLTVFYTPGGAGGWVLDLVLRGYFAVARRFSAPVRLAALVPVPVRARHPSGLRLSNLVEK